MITFVCVLLSSIPILIAYLRYRRHHHALEQWWRKPPTSLKRRVELDS